MSFYPTLEEKLEIDKKEIIRVMLAHSEAKYMVQVLKKVPPKDLGYMWGLNNTDGYWSERQKEAIQIMHVWVLQKGWESSGYAIMFRALEKEIKNIDLRFLNSEP